MKLNFKAKLMMYMFVIGLVPMMVAMVIAFNKAKNEIVAQANSRATMVGSSKAHLISSYFEQEFLSLKDLASSAFIQSALKDFSLGMQAYNSMELKNEEKSKVESFYKDIFGKTYSDKNSGASFDSAPVLASLDQVTMQAQYDFLANNVNPLGEKNNLDKATRDVPYNNFHAVYHPELNSFLKRHKLYDIFIVNPEGRVVYTVFKEADFSTNIATGPLASSGLGKAFEQSKKLKAGEVDVEDYAAYGPSYELPASFASTPIFVSGEYKGSLIVQLPLDLISSISATREGLGEKGQSLLFGSDGRLRADAFRDKEHYSAVESFKKGSTLTIKTKAAEEAIAGKTGVVLQQSYDGLETLAYYQPIKIGDETWSIVTELSTDEVLKGLNDLRFYQIVLFAISCCVIGVFSWWLGSNFASKLQAVIDSISKSSAEVSEASKKSESTATELSTAATEQAASLQETMASLEEISAMVAQNADSAGKARVEVDKNAKSTEEGSHNVGEMIHAIDEIKTTNEEILSQMEASNREFGAIVQIISEIGNKTKVINDIVFQTKLLSFNASVEAARAGEHGKGFAVVAEEVGNLAQMSGNAAKEITDMLSNSIKRVNGIVDETKRKVDQLVEVGRDKVTYGQSVADKCRVALVDISSSSKNLTSMISEIAQASKEQAQGVQEINTAIAQLDHVTQQNATVSQQSSFQAQSLLGQTHDLQRALDSLIGFVNGTSNNEQSSTKSAEENIKAATRTIPEKLVKVVKAKSKVESKEKSSEKVLGKIVEYRKPVTKEVSKKPESLKSIKAVSEKVAAGSDIVPGNNNPSFEDF